MSIEEKDRANNKLLKVLVLIIIILVLIMVIGGLIIFDNHEKRNAADVASETVEEVGKIIEEDIIGSEGEVSTITESEIRDVFEISELQTADYIYNAIVHVPGDDESGYNYHVAYEGTVTAGIDFEDIKIEVDDQTKTITILIPQVTIIDAVVDAGSLKYIFTKEKYDNESVYKEAYSLCQKDLDDKAENDTELTDLAKENVKQVVEALVQPWVNQIDKEYSINVETE